MTYRTYEIQRLTPAGYASVPGAAIYSTRRRAMSGARTIKRRLGLGYGAIRIISRERGRTVTYTV